ncbi:hypothetical protein pb186bvf_006692 [Paramecium bursaria]
MESKNRPEIYIVASQFKIHYVKFIVIHPFDIIIFFSGQIQMSFGLLLLLLLPHLLTSIPSALLNQESQESMSSTLPLMSHPLDVVKGATDVLKTIKEVKAVQTACTSAEILEYAGLTIDIGKCLQETYVVYQKATAAFNDYEQGGVTPKFIDDVDQVTLEISPLVSLCDSPAAAEHLNVLFPPTCIVCLDSLAKDGLKIVQDQNKPVAVAEDLIRLAKDYNASKKVCPFIH